MSNLASLAKEVKIMYSMEILEEAEVGCRIMEEQEDMYLVAW